MIFDGRAAATFPLAYRMCGRRARAEEVVQEAFLSVWRSGMRYDPSRATVRAWMRRIVHNKAIDTFRRESVKTGQDVHDDWAALRGCRHASGSMAKSSAALTPSSFAVP